jgi:hypothetical protein
MMGREAYIEWKGRVLTPNMEMCKLSNALSSQQPLMDGKLQTVVEFSFILARINCPCVF